MPEQKIWKAQTDARVRAFHAAERYAGAFDDLFDHSQLELEMWLSFMASLPRPRCIPLKVREAPSDR